jgi:sigma-B regulation protein RsbU (phosphoserine phosphatase)
VLERLAASSLFQGVRFRDLGVILGKCPVQRFRAGEVALAPGDTNRFLSIVLEGEFHIKREADAVRILGLVGPGQCFGEMSVLDGGEVSAIVVAAGAAEVLSIPEQVVWSDLLALPGVARNLMRVMSARLRNSIRAQHAVDDMLKELRLANEIQASMLPRGNPLFPDHAELDGCALMDPAAEVGGDFFDAFFTDDHRVFLSVGDVAGKGMAAALFMARSMTLLRQHALRRVAPREVLNRVNDALAAGNESATFVAAFCAQLDTATGELRYANGGGGAPLLQRSGRWERLPLPKGLVVGAMEGFGYEAARTRLRAGDTLLVFTDGITEAANEQGELFSERRLKALLEATAAASAADLVSLVREEVRRFVGSSLPSDDLTLMAIRYQRPRSEEGASPIGPS